eukprot:6180505-Pleurochrysis_carterae.AAC.1
MALYILGFKLPQRSLGFDKQSKREAESEVAQHKSRSVVVLGVGAETNQVQFTHEIYASSSTGPMGIQRPSAYAASDSVTPLTFLSPSSPAYIMREGVTCAALMKCARHLVHVPSGPLSINASP